MKYLSTIFPKSQKEVLLFCKQILYMYIERLLCTMGYDFTLTGMARIRKPDNNKCW